MSLEINHQVKVSPVFGIEIIDASLGMSLLIAMLAGVISFLSPCVLPIVPPYLAYMAGTSPSSLSETQGYDRRVILSACMFVLGLSTVFLIMGFTASLLGQMFLTYQHYLGYAAGIMIILFGLHFLGVIRIPFLFREARFDTGAVGGTPQGAYILGLAFAFGWTPCIGPVLGSILSLAAVEGSVARGTILLGIYALGLGIPFLLAAIFIRRFLSATSGLKRHMGLIEKVMGALLILVGILLLTGGFAAISYWMLETFPILATMG